MTYEDMSAFTASWWAAERAYRADSYGGAQCRRALVDYVNAGCPRDATAWLDRWIAVDDQPAPAAKKEKK